MRVVGTISTNISPGELSESQMAYEREVECSAWLRAHLPQLAVDDRAWLFKPFHRNVYLVGGKTGLSDKDVDARVARVMVLL